MNRSLLVVASRVISLIAIGLMWGMPGFAQTPLDSLERRVNEQFGVDKLKTLHEIIPLYLSRNDARQALKYARQAERLTEDVIRRGNQLLSEADFRLKPETYFLLGQAYQLRGQYMESKDAYEKALRESVHLEEPALRRQAELAVRQIDSISAATGQTRKRFLGEVFQDVGQAIDNSSRDFRVSAALKLAKLYENKDNFSQAIEQYTIAADLLKDKGAWEQEAEIRKLVADLLAESGRNREAQTAYLELRKINRQLADSVGLAEIEARLDAVRKQAGVAVRPPQAPAPPPTPKISLPGIEMEKVEKDLVIIRRVAERAESAHDYEKSLDYYKQYLALQQQVAEEKRLQELALLDQAHEIESRDREIMLLKQNDEITRLQLEKKEAELKEQSAFRRNVFIMLALLAGLGFTLFLLYTQKRRDHKQLAIAFTNLTTAQDKLKAAEQRVKNLLDQHLSGAVADELLAARGANKVERRFVCVLFLDIRDFTPFAENLNPEEIIAYQNKVFGFMIDTINKHGGIVNQIMGDGFMATFGAPVSAGNDCMEAYLASQEIMDELQARSASGDIPPTRVGIGLHAGYVVTGNVGTETRKQYSITGNPVIIAARLEQLNKEFGSTLIVSKEVYDRLPENVRKPTQFNDVMVKGRSNPVAVAVF